MLSLSALALAVAVSSGWAFQSAGALPPRLRARLTQDRFDVVSSIRGLPLGVREELQRMFGGGLDISEPGESFRGTDATSDPRLPPRRLAAAACSPQYCIVYYERGGVAHTWHALLFHWTPEGTELELGGNAPGALPSADAVRTAMLSGAVKEAAGPW